MPDDGRSASCFAIGEGGFACVTLKGNVVFHGIPGNVNDILKKQQFANVDFIAIGPQGEYFLQKANGKRHWSGLSSALETALHEKGRVKKLVLGPNGI